MSGAVGAGGPPGPGPGRRPPPDAWARGIVGWHLAFWLLWALSVVAALIWHSGDAFGPMPVTLTLLAVLGAAYLCFGQPAARSEGRLRARVYLVVAVVVLGLLFYVSPGLSFLLFLAFPQMWFLTGTRLEGTAFTIALGLAAAAGLALREGTPDAWRGATLSLLVSLAFSIVLGLWITSIITQSEDRADLIAQLEATRDELARAHHDAGVVAERERLSREIHDTIAQGLTSVVMLSQVAARHLTGGRSGEAATTVAAIEDCARQNLADARALVASYSAVGVDDGLPAALRRLGERFARETGVVVEVRIDGRAARAVAGDPGPHARAHEVVLLRSVQEGLANVRKHAAATRVTVALTADDDGRTAVEVCDDGVGFDPDGSPGQGFGLDGLSRRAGEVGGEVAVASTPGEGTVLRVAVPRG
ncbi:MAG: sensor histidine kinase [Kineosporiaceae bacterium]